jgi:hypothetical protein
MERLTFRGATQLSLLAELRERDLNSELAHASHGEPIRRDPRSSRQLGRWMRGALRSGLRPTT